MTRLRSNAIVLIALALAGGAVSVPAARAGAATGRTRPARLAVPIPPGSTALGALADGQTLSFGIVLAPSHPQKLRALVDGVRNPASPEFGHYLAPGEFARRFGPTAEQIAAVTGWLRGAGLDDVTVAGSVVSLRTTAGGASRALGLSMQRYRRRADPTHSLQPKLRWYRPRSQEPSSRSPD